MSSPSLPRNQVGLTFHKGRAVSVETRGGMVRLQEIDEDGQLHGPPMYLPESKYEKLLYDWMTDARSVRDYQITKNALKFLRKNRPPIPDLALSN